MRFCRPIGLLAGIASVALAQDEAGEDVQEVTAVFSGELAGYGNDANDSAVAAVLYKNVIYIAANTEGDLEGNNVGGSDFIVKAFDSDLEPENAIAVQFGGSGDDYVRAMTSTENFQIAIVGSTYSESDDDHLFDLVETRERDWFIALLGDTDLSVEFAYVNGSRNDDQEATAVATTADKELIVAGLTWGDYFEENVGADNGEDYIGYDAWVLKIDEELDSNNEEFEWAIQFGTVAYDEPTAMVIDDDGFIYVTGTTRDFGDIVSAADEEDTPSMWVYCLDPDDGTVVWSVDTELGVLSDESTPSGIIMSEDGKEVYVAGHTSGIIPGFDGDSFGEAELFVMGLDIDDGATNWVYQSEENATAFGGAGIVLADDGSPIIGGIAFGNQFNLSFTYWEGGSGDMIAAKIDTELLEVSKYFVAAAASNLTQEWAFAMLKNEDVTDGVFLIGQQNGDFEEDEEPEDTYNYLLLSVELDELPEEEDTDDGPGYDYWPIGVGIVVVGGILFVAAFKWAEHSQARKAKLATMV